MSILPTWPIAAGTLVIGVALGTGGTAMVKNAKIERIEAAHAEESRQREAVRVSDELAARASEQRLTERAGVLAQENQIEKARVADARAALADSLRNRPERPTSTGATRPVAAACPGATGAELYRADGEFLAGEAARADNLRAALGQCYAQYDAARALINQPATPASSTQR